MLAELAQQALLTGVCQHFALPFEVELPIEGVWNMAVSCQLWAGSGLPPVGTAACGLSG